MTDGIRTQAEVVGQLPAHIAADFDCIHGPHRWSEGLAGRFYFCLDCPKVRRIPWPDMRSLYGVAHD